MIMAHCRIFRYRLAGSRSADGHFFTLAAVFVPVDAFAHLFSII